MGDRPNLPVAFVRINERKMTMKAVWNVLENIVLWMWCLLAGAIFGKIYNAVLG